MNDAWAWAKACTEGRTPAEANKIDKTIEIIETTMGNGSTHTGELLCPPPEVADGDDVEKPIPFGPTLNALF